MQSENQALLQARKPKVEDGKLCLHIDFICIRFAHYKNQPCLTKDTHQKIVPDVQIQRFFISIHMETLQIHTTI